MRTPGVMGGFGSPLSDLLLRCPGFLCCASRITAESLTNMLTCLCCSSRQAMYEHLLKKGFQTEVKPLHITLLVASFLNSSFYACAPEFCS